MHAVVNGSKEWMGERTRYWLSKWRSRARLRVLSAHSATRGKGCAREAAWRSRDEQVFKCSPSARSRVSSLVLTDERWAACSLLIGNWIAWALQRQIMALSNRLMCTLTAPRRASSAFFWIDISKLHVEQLFYSISSTVGAEKCMQAELRIEWHCVWRRMPPELSKEQKTIQIALELVCTHCTRMYTRTKS